MANDDHEILQRCQSALRLKYDASLRAQVESCFDAERKLIEEQGFSNVLVQAVDFWTKQKQHGRACHLIGSGCSSMINYLLDLSEVDPIEHRTLIQRFWLTSSHSPPTFQFVVASPREDTTAEILIPANVSVHPMTPLEQIPAIVQRTLPQISIPMNDPATFEAITDGDTDGVVQFEPDHVRRLAAKIRPRSIDDLAIVTALAAIESSRPDVTADILARFEQTLQTGPRHKDSSTNRLEVPLFQETILTILHDDIGLDWADAWRFILDAAKHKLSDNHPLWDEALQIASHRHQDPIESEQLLRYQAKASLTAVCRAHHIANAIVSYKAAFLRSHFRTLFERVRPQELASDAESLPRINNSRSKS